MFHLYNKIPGHDVGYVKSVDTDTWDSPYVRGAVSVLWKATEEIGRYRVGAEGCVDVMYSRMTESATGGHYYENHLPFIGKSSPNIKLM